MRTSSRATVSRSGNCSSRAICEMEYRGSPEILDHVERNIGPIFQSFQEIVSDDLQIDVLHVASSLFRRYEVLVTSGMSAKPMTVPDGSTESAFAEVLALLPRKWPLTKADFNDENTYWPIRMLKDIARQVHQTNTWIGFGHTLAMADSFEQLQPYAPSTNLCACAILPPLTLGEASWCLQRQDGEHVFFWSRYRSTNKNSLSRWTMASDALMDQFDRLGVSDRIEPDRTNVALV